MKKFLFAFAIFCGIVFVLGIIGRLTNTFASYKTPGGANEPTIKQGSHFFVSNLKSPKRFDFICVRAELPETGKFLGVYRLCGIEGDVIEIKNGDLYLNKKMIDDQFNLMHRYSIAVKDFSPLAEIVSESQEGLNTTGDSVYAMINSGLIKEKGIKAVRVNLPISQYDEQISKKFSHAWNQDHFGPITVPPENYFVLGDNRYEAADSRYQGCIPIENFVATVLWK
jgi:signal peptidase I